MEFLREYFYGGIDWHDSYSNLTVVYHNGKICTNKKDYISAIANKLFDDMAKWFPITKEEFIDILKKVRENREKTNLPLYNEQKDGTMEIDSFTDDDGTVYHENELNIYIDGDDFLTIQHSTWGGQALFYYHYEVMNIDNEDVAYMVCESFHCPTKGVPVVERLYKPLFDDLKEAESYRNELDAKIKDRMDKGGYSSCESTLNIVSRKKLEATDFYKKNMQANALMEQRGTNPFEDDFRTFVDAHIEDLQK